MSHGEHGPSIWTIGHSNHDFDRLLELLSSAQVEFVVDVRSYPYSQYASQFNREEMERGLRRAEIGYVFLGEELGGRPSSDDHYDKEGHALYSEMAEEAPFLRAVERLVVGSAENRIALLCSCGKPDDCHRRLLVGKVLAERGVKLIHILPDGQTLEESTVPISPDDEQEKLFEEEEVVWRSTQSVSHRRRLNTSSAA